MEIFITISCGILAGLALGLTGGGGSNFAVPLLIYVVGVPAGQAMPVALAAVALGAAVGAAQVVRANLVAWQPTLAFAAGGMLGAPLGLKLAQGMDARMLLTGFSLLALAVGASMWRRASLHPQESAVVRALPEGQTSGPVCRLSQDGRLRFTAPCSIALMFAGLVTGVLSGLFGVGGGFLIVPALMAITRMGIHGAVATSLVVIAMTGMTGAAYALMQGRIAWVALLPFALGGTCGMLLGRRVAARVAGPVLQKSFSGIIVAVALSMLTRSLL